MPGFLACLGYCCLKLPFKIVIPASMWYNAPMENGTNMGMEIQGVPEIQTVDAILVENPSLAESEVVVESGMVANIGPAAPAQVADNALIVLPAPSASDEMLEVQ